MSCTKSNFLSIYVGSNIKNLQAKVDKNITKPNNYTPNIDFLDSAWNGYISSGCNYFNSSLTSFRRGLTNFRKNTDIYNLQLEKIDFFDKLKATCGCSKSASVTKKVKLIKEVSFDTSSIPASGATREFVIKGDKDAVFNIYISNEDSPKKYYNFQTKQFTTSRFVLEDIVIKEHSESVFVNFPKVSDDDHYDITVFANPEFDTKHIGVREVRLKDKDQTLDVNKTTGSNSALLHKKLYQYTDNTITLTAISPNSVSALTGYSQTNQTFTAPKYGGKVKFPFTITVTANAVKAYHILKQPTPRDIGTFVSRTIGSDALPIYGEDVSSSTYYRWPINNITGLKNGMVITGTNVTANSIISDYKDVTKLDTSNRLRPATPSSFGMVETRGEKQLQSKTSNISEQSKLISKYGNETIIGSTKRPLKSYDTLKNYKNIVALGVEATAAAVFTNGVITSQVGNIVLNKQQADALKGDTIKVLGAGPEEIKGLTGYEIKVSNLKAELTKPTTTTTAAVAGAEIAVNSVQGVINNVSRLSGIGINESLADPLVTSGGGATGSGNWVVDASQTLESGATLTVENTGRLVTITGDIEFTKIGESDVTIYFNIERFLAAS